MSRNIPDKAAVKISTEEITFRDTAKGKLVFTDYRGKQCMMLINAGRATAVFFPEEQRSKIGAVYIGKVKNVSSNINACFVEISDREVCFLSLKDAVSPLLLNRKYDGRILAGDEILVQVARDAQKTKPASVTARISSSNDYFALELGFDRINYSAKLDKKQRALAANLLKECGISDNDNRLLQDALTNNVNITEGIGIPIGMIVRTKARMLTDSRKMSEQFQIISDEFVSLLHSAFHRSSFSCLKKAPEPFEYILKQLILPEEYDEIITDNPKAYSQLIDYIREHMPEKKVRLYEDKTLSLKSLYSIDTKMETSLSERVWLKSGGYLIIQPTEALTAIDVNSGKYEARKGSEETALKTNLEAAEEIALQLRLRNLSGIIIVDFINMKEEASREKLISFLKAKVQKDVLQTTVVDMTPLGLMELTRKKESKPLYGIFKF